MNSEDCVVYVDNSKVNVASGELYIKNDDAVNIWGVSDNLSSTVTFNEETYEDIFHKLMEKFNKHPIVEHKCHNCGGIIELDENKHVFRCPYCNSVYAIGTN